MHCLYGTKKAVTEEARRDVWLRSNNCWHTVTMANMLQDFGDHRGKFEQGNAGAWLTKPGSQFERCRSADEDSSGKISFSI